MPGPRAGHRISVPRSQRSARARIGRAEQTLARHYDRIDRGLRQRLRHMMPTRRERADDVIRHCAFDAHFIRQPLMMNARSGHGFSDIHAAVDDIDDNLKRRGDDAAC